jgi:WXG100 family type VII secretion target
MTIRFEHPEFHASVAEVRTACAELCSARARASGEVDLLLDGWHGAAARAFAEAWESWLTSSREVSSGLAALAEALDGFQTDLVSRDAFAGASLGRLAERLA